MSDASRFHQIFNANRDAALAASDLTDLSKRIGGHPWIKHYAGGWAERYLATFQAHPDTYLDRGLWLPAVKTFGDLFEAARLIDSNIGNQMYAEQAIAAKARVIGPGFMFCSDAMRLCRHLGGKHTLRHFPNGDLVRGIFGGAKFHVLYVKPQEDVKAAWRAEMGPDHYEGDGAFCLNSFEVVRRADGFLVIARGGGGGYGTQWLSLIPLSQESELRAMLPEVDRALLDVDDTAKAAFEAGIQTVEGKPQLRDARAEFVKGTFGESDGWRAEFRRDGTWFPVMNANGGCARYATKGAALDGAAIALGYQIHR